MALSRQLAASSPLFCLYTFPEPRKKDGAAHASVKLAGMSHPGEQQRPLRVWQHLP